jgi:hypothetical protein
MAYVLPQVTVFQEFNIVPANAAAPRAVHITGGHAKLFRYSNADEKAIINLGEYDSVADQAYLWPERPAGGVVDHTFTKLYVEDALLEYYVNNASSGNAVAPVSGYKNRVRDSGTSFKTNTASYPRSAALYDRDAKVGDYVYIRGVSSGTEYTLNTTIRGFVGDAVAAVTGAASSAGSNKASQSLSTNIDILGLKNSITLTADASGYNGLEDGDIDESYTVEVTQSSIGGDLTTARLRVTSSSGNDNQFDVNSTASASSHADGEDISPNDLVVGQKWRVRVKQAFTPPSATSGGTYTGLRDTTYIVQVTKGGTYASSPEITVSTTTGYDVGSPVVVSASATAVAVGNYGVTVSFNQTALCKGDKYYIVVTAAGQGAMKTLILADDLPEELESAVDLDLKLYIKKNILVEKNLEADAPNVAYTVSDTEITVQSGIMLHDSTWTDAGALQPLPLKGGTLFVEYRAWLPDYVATVESITDPAEISSLLGQLSPDNPLCWGVYLALQNANGQPVFFTSVTDPDNVDDWTIALEGLDGQDQIYNLVPLTTNETVLGLWKAHVESQSGPEVGNWRAAVFSIAVTGVKKILSDANSVDGNVILAKLADDNTTSGTQYTLLSVPANNAKFLTKGVKAGDTVRYLYSTDAFGQETYSEFVVDEVLSESSIRLVTGNGSPITVGQKVEIWRTLDRAGRAAEAIEQIGAHSSRRVVVIANPTVGLEGATFPGYFAACAVAGLRSGVLPQQGLTRVTISGIDDVGELVTELNGSQLNLIAGAGGWILAKDATGSIFNRHAITTDTTDTNTREEVIRVNVDSISYQYKAAFEPYIGRVNITPGTLDLLRQRFEMMTEELRVNGTPNTGGQLISAEIADIRQHAVFKDKVVIQANLNIPYPMNNIELKLVV